MKQVWLVGLKLIKTFQGVFNVKTDSLGSVDIRDLEQARLEREFAKLSVTGWGRTGND
ncbi:MAG: hypothetical protein RBT63_03265 [Bdellovibrionales bacterium]|jgi:hypothetical protein|nr:hypothetical protein [Bdellovibrionales bacterium]